MKNARTYFDGFEKENLENRILDPLFSIALAHFQLGNMVNSIKYFEKSIEFSKKYGRLLVREASG
mgnify:CR=1 FL=1